MYFHFFFGCLIRNAGLHSIIVFSLCWKPLYTSFSISALKAARAIPFCQNWKYTLPNMHVISPKDGNTKTCQNAWQCSTTLPLVTWWHQGSFKPWTWAEKCFDPNPWTDSAGSSWWPPLKSQPVQSSNFPQCHEFDPQTGRVGENCRPLFGALVKLTQNDQHDISTKLCYHISIRNL